jgi:hypothetical protein
LNALFQAALFLPSWGRSPPSRRHEHQAEEEGVFFIDNHLVWIRDEQDAVHARAFAVKVDTKRLPDFLFSGLFKDFQGHKTHRFENGGTNQLRKAGKREVFLSQPLPQTL